MKRIINRNSKNEIEVRIPFFSLSLERFQKILLGQLQGKTTKKMGNTLDIQPTTNMVFVCIVLIVLVHSPLAFCINYVPSSSYILPHIFCSPADFHNRVGKKKYGTPLLCNVINNISTFKHKMKFVLKEKKERENSLQNRDTRQHGSFTELFMFLMGYLFRNQLRMPF